MQNVLQALVMKCTGYLNIFHLSSFIMLPQLEGQLLDTIQNA